MLRGQSFGNQPESYLTPVRELRNAVIGACAVPCRDPSHGVERYTQDVLGPRTESDWLRGGSTSDGYCDSLRSSEINSHPEVDISIEGALLGSHPSRGLSMRPTWPPSAFTALHRGGSPLYCVDAVRDCVARCDKTPPNTGLTMSQQKPSGLLSLGRWTAKA
jgi:hypothetical protein